MAFHLINAGLANRALDEERVAVILLHDYEHLGIFEVPVAQ